MKIHRTFVFFIVIGCNVTLALSDDSDFFTSDKNGNLQLGNITMYDDNSRFNAEKDTVFYLYTRKNREHPQIIRYSNSQNLTKSNYDKLKPTKMITHGWNSNGNEEVCWLTKNITLDALDVNVICVDWGSGANAPYRTAVSYVSEVGTLVAKFVDWLIKKGSSAGNFHFMGHSLGAHVFGIAGRSLKRGRIPYITACDPARPLWGPESERIMPTDGDYVEVIHTNAGNLGLEEAIGHNDFYPNGGKRMPGCGMRDVACSHGKSFQYFAYSMDNRHFMANQCDDLDQIQNNQCSNISKLHMGGSRPKDGRGIFLLFTTDTPPFFE